MRRVSAARGPASQGPASQGNRAGTGGRAPRDDVPSPAGTAPPPVDLPSLDADPPARTRPRTGSRRPSNAALVATAAVLTLVAVTVPRLFDSDDTTPAAPTPPVQTSAARSTAVGGQRPGLVVGPDLSSPSDLPQQPTQVLKPFSANPVRSWRLSLADAAGLTLREALSLPEHERPDAGRASIALRCPRLRARRARRTRSSSP